MPLKIDILTLFPKMISGFLSESIIGRALSNELIKVETRDIRDWSTDKHRRVDDRPFGGGAGMLMAAQPVFDTIESVCREDPADEVIYLCPDGEPLTNEIAKELSLKKHLVLLSGHYEGIDQRIRDTLITREISIGDYVLTNGTLAAAVLVDCIARQVPGVLGEENSLTSDSFNDSLLSFPQYTRPEVFRGMQVPPVLLSGDHAEIKRWRREQQLKKTQERRPDLLSKRQNNEPANS